MARKKHFKEGDIVRVPINDKEHTYLRKLPGFLIAMYDCKTTEEIGDLNYIVSTPILFIVTVYRTDLAEGEWRKVGSLALEHYLTKEPAFFIKEIGTTDSYRIYENGNMRPATKEECEHLEINAVWSAQNLKDRLNDIYYGDPDRKRKQTLKNAEPR